MLLAFLTRDLPSGYLIYYLAWLRVYQGRLTNRDNLGIKAFTEKFRWLLHMGRLMFDEFNVHVVMREPSFLSVFSNRQPADLVNVLVVSYRLNSYTVAVLHKGSWVDEGVVLVGDIAGNNGLSDLVLGGIDICDCLPISSVETVLTQEQLVLVSRFM